MHDPVFFFTELDESRRPKGSRDPVGLEPIWSQAGRKLVGNLTTVTRSLDNFILTLLGFAVAARGSGGQTNGVEPDSPLFYLRFERFEQLAAWGRVAFERSDVIGTRMIAARNDARNGGTVAIGAGAAARILGDQRRSGLWGLYSSALMGTKLIDTKRKLTPQGFRLVKPFLDRYLSPAMGTLRACMDNPALTIDVDPATLDVGPLLDSHGRDELAAHLLRDGDGDMQQAIYEQVRSPNFAQIEKVGVLFRTLASDPASQPKLAAYARNVIQLERMLVVVAAAFDFLLGPQLRSLKQVVQRFVDAGWGEPSVWSALTPPENEFRRIFTGVWQRRVDQLYRVVGHLHAGAIAEFIYALLDFHAGIMRERGGPAWVYIDESGAMRGIMGEQRALPEPRSLLGRWSNDYFIGAFISLLRSTSAHAASVDHEVAA
ncbi:MULTISPECIES: hypothetical protein [unclassified Caballeronia]|jgi:hypothetical protein|uniref:hypothetical protein n=1 Tax=unclassified Caballeronia TaxID=2646786 RepID=UPI0020290256|nr:MULTISPECIES: hypothetical protein [unclassified Caballeronia]